MKILFISHDLIGGNVAYLLKKEGHDVKLFIEEKEGRKNFDNLVSKTNNWRNELKWVGKDGLIMFDDVGYGKIQDKLREEGYIVLGGSEIGEKLEIDREFGQKICEAYGIKTVPLRDFLDIRQAIDYVKSHPAAWVIKQNTHSFKDLTYMGHFDDGKDVINVLENYEKNNILSSKTITLQQRIDGVEVGVARYFNGTNWVGPIEVNIEHTKFFPGDLGPITSEMGTLAWYDTNENNKLFKETLERLKPFLQQVNFRGDMSLNCVVNKDGAFPLEATARLGTPITHLQSELNISPWGEFLYAIAKGEDYQLKFKSGYGVVVMLAVPPFPYTYKLDKHSFSNTDVYFDNKLTDKDFKHIHFEEIALRAENSKQYYISDTRGYIMYVTGHGLSVEAARGKVYNLIKNIHIPKMFYRNDIGMNFIRRDCARLKKWGYLEESELLILEEKLLNK